MANSPRLAELADLITRREYNWAMVRARVHEEEVVRRYAADHSMQYTTLADTIEDLYRQDVINDASRENLHTLRILGNQAVHEEDNDPQDAKKAYELLKQELAAYSDRKYGHPEPVESRRRSEQEESPERRRVRKVDSTETDRIDMSYAEGRRRTQGRSSQKNTISSAGIYSVLRILIPVLIIVLIVVLIINLSSGKKTVQETSEEVTETAAEEKAAAEAEAETEAAAATEAPTTEAPTTEAPVSWQIKGEGVRIRLASDPGQIYTTASNGTFIGPVTDYETDNETYRNFARFTYDGKDVIVSKDYIEKVTN